MKSVINWRFIKSIAQISNCLGRQRFPKGWSRHRTFPRSAISVGGAFLFASSFAAKLVNQDSVFVVRLVKLILKNADFTLQRLLVEIFVGSASAPSQKA